MFSQSDAIRDYVFPIAVAEREGQQIVATSILGSAFLIGSRGFALTAKHVISGSEGQRIVGVFALPSGGWYCFEVTIRDVHPVEDVALVKLDGGPWKSFFRISNTTENASCNYRLFGYPDDTTFELNDGSQVIIRPDLVYNQPTFRILPRRFLEFPRC